MLHPTDTCTYLAGWPCVGPGPCRYDPNGGAYLLLAYTSGSVILWDTSGHSSVAAFDRCAVGLVGVRWMAWAPGNFMALRYYTCAAQCRLRPRVAVDVNPLPQTSSSLHECFSLSVHEQQPKTRFNLMALRHFSCRREQLQDGSSESLHRLAEVFHRDHSPRGDGQWHPRRRVAARAGTGSRTARDLPRR